MDSLPNELLLEVFSWLQDGETLLDGVALVCKRWHALSRDPQAWRGVRVEFGMLDWHWRDAGLAESEKAAMDKARIVLHAPVLRYLGWSWNYRGPPHINVPQGMALSAVRRSRAAIREIYMSLVSHMANPAWAVFHGLLWRNREHLTSLRLETPSDRKEEVHIFRSEAVASEECDWALEEDQSDKVAAWAEADGDDSRSLLEILVELRCLQSLDLLMHRPSYAGEFRVKEDLLPALRSLRLDGKAPPQLMVDLVRGSAARLRHLDMPDGHGLGGHDILPPQLLESVSQCVQLRSLATSLMNVGCVVGLRHLRRLELWLPYEEVQPEDAVRIAVLLVQHGEALAGVRRLSLRCGFKRKQVWEAARPALAELLLAVTRAAHNVTEVQIFLDQGFEGLVDQLLGCMPRLQRVTLNWAGEEETDHVEALAALPELRCVLVHAFSSSLAKSAIVAPLEARLDLKRVWIY